jgi:hypothetical protein
LFLTRFLAGQLERSLEIGISQAKLSHVEPAPNVTLLAML